MCSCRGSSVQLSSPPANILKTVLLTCGSLALATASWSVAVTSREEDKQGEKFSVLLSLSARVQGKAQGGKRRMKSTQDMRFVCAPRLSATKQTQSLGQADLAIMKINSSGSLPSFSRLSLSYINVSRRHAPNNRKHKGPTDKLNESSPEELEHYISIQGLSSISVQRVFSVFSVIMFPHTPRCLLMTSGC